MQLKYNIIFNCNTEDIVSKLYDYEHLKLNVSNTI